MVSNLTVGKENTSSTRDDIPVAPSGELEILRTYLVHLVDEDIKAFAPLGRKYAPMDKSDPSVTEHQWASWLACAIPTEVMYKMTEVPVWLSSPKRAAWGRQRRRALPR